MFPVPVLLQFSVLTYKPIQRAPSAFFCERKGQSQAAKGGLLVRTKVFGIVCQLQRSVPMMLIRSRIGLVGPTENSFGIYDFKSTLTETGSTSFFGFIDKTAFQDSSHVCQHFIDSFCSGFGLRPLISDLLCFLSNDIVFYRVAQKVSHYD